MRLAMLYALLDRTDTITTEHLTAAIALWDYSERSVLYVFGDALGDPIADDLARLIRQSGSSGVTRTAISEYLGRNTSSDRINRAARAAPQTRNRTLQTGRDRGPPRCTLVRGAGRVQELCWFNSFLS